MVPDKDFILLLHNGQNLSFLPKWKSNSTNSVSFELFPSLETHYVGAPEELTTVPSRIQTGDRVCPNQMCWVYDSRRGLKESQTFKMTPQAHNKQFK